PLRVQAAKRRGMPKNSLWSEVLISLDDRGVLPNTTFAQDSPILPILHDAVLASGKLVVHGNDRRDSEGHFMGRVVEGRLDDGTPIVYAAMSDGEFRNDGLS